MASPGSAVCALLIGLMSGVARVRLWAGWSRVARRFLVGG